MADNRSIAHVAHPVPTVYFPPRARLERFVFTKHQTPVQIREVGPEEMVFWGEVEDPTIFAGTMSFHVFEGKLWTRVRPLHSTGYYSKANFGREDLIKALEGPLEGTGTRLNRVFTSLVYRTPIYAAHDIAGDERGFELDSLDIKRIVSRDIEAASKEVERFVSERIVIAGTEVYVRSCDPLVWFSQTTESFHLHPLPRTSDGPKDATLCRWDDREDFIKEIRRKRSVGPSRIPEPPAGTSDLLGDDDLELLANGLPDAIMRAVMLVTRPGMPLKSVFEHGQDDLDWLRGVAFRGKLGLIQGAEALDVISKSAIMLKTLPSGPLCSRWYGPEIYSLQGAEYRIGGALESRMAKVRREAADHNDLEAIGGMTF